MKEENNELSQRMHKYKRKSISYGSRSPMQMNNVRRSFKDKQSNGRSRVHQNQTDLQTHKSDTSTQYLYLKNKRIDTDKDISADKSSNVKLKRNTSSVLGKMEKERLATDSNVNQCDYSPQGGKHKALIYTYLNKKKKPIQPTIRPQSSQKNLSFTTINNISMQNLINRNISAYHMFLNKSQLPNKDANNLTTIFNNNSPAMPVNSTNIKPSNCDDSSNFHKKLKKYINKRSSVNKKIH